MKKYKVWNGYANAWTTWLFNAETDEEARTEALRVIQEKELDKQDGRFELYESVGSFEITIPEED